MNLRALRNALCLNPVPPGGRYREARTVTRDKAGDFVTGSTQLQSRQEYPLARPFPPLISLPTIRPTLHFPLQLPVLGPRIATVSTVDAPSSSFC